MELMYNAPHPIDYDELFASWPAKAREGCAAGIAEECSVVAGHPDNPDQLTTLQFLCDVRRDDCTQLAKRYGSLKDRWRERDTLEIACQYGQRAWRSCIDLGEGYLHHRFEEPVPGRGQALIDWGCREIAPHAGPDLFETLPVCRRAKKN